MAHEPDRPEGAPVGAPAPGLPDGENSDSRLVWNPFLGEWTGLAPGRMSRRELTAECPFCADLTSGRVAPGTRAWVRPNDFPAFRPPVGECLILIYSDEHDRTFADLAVSDVVRVIGLWRQVYRDLAPKYVAVMSWETSGAAIGQTQFHPHGQTYGLSIVPDTLVRELAYVEQSHAAGRGCPFCAELLSELDGPRLVYAGAHWVGFVPAYARYPYQVRLSPRRHTSAIDGIGGVDGEGEEAVELASILLRLIRAYNAAFQAPMPYMLALHQLSDERFHVHIELLPVGRAPGKLKLAASSEMAWGFWVNDSFPEAKAAELRDLLVKERAE
jgi:UDPglucose--hexose-1-phosphate uridylyltransferase